MSAALPAHQGLRVLDLLLPPEDLPLQRLPDLEADVPPRLPGWARSVRRDGPGLGVAGGGPGRLFSGNA